MKRTMGLVIKQLREENRITQAELAKILNVSPSTIGMWENNERSPNEDKKEAIADYFNVDMNYLYGKTLVRNSYREINQDSYIYESAGIDYIRIPLYDNICCGDGGFVDDNIIEMIAIPSKGLNPNIEYFCQYASGESMIDAGIEEGDLLVFEKCDKVSSGVIGCFCIADNEATCKKYKEMENIIILQPMNTDFDPIIIDPYNNNVRCIGKLKKVIKSYDW